VRLILWHGYLLEGTGSNIYTQHIARAWGRLGHDVCVICQQRRPGRFDLGPRVRVVRPDIGPLLPVFVVDRYEGVEARHVADFTVAELDRYTAANVAAIAAEVDINVACSLGMLSQGQVDELASIGVHRYNHNLETARSYFPDVVTTHSFEERWDTCEMVRKAGMELCCGGILGMGETLDQRAEFAAQLATLAPDEVPLNFLNPRPGTPFGDQQPMSAIDALRAIATFRLVMPRTILRFAGGREITLGDLAERGVRGGINAVIVGNYLTTLGRSADEDLSMLAELKMPIKALAKNL